MPKNSVSEWSTVSSGNGDIAGLTLGLDMPPSYVNNSIQEMMAQIKQWKDGYIDPLTGLPVYQSLTVQNIDIEGNANFKGGMKLDGSYGDNGQVLMSSGSSATPNWTTLEIFITGMIMLWSGSTGSVPSGWRLCDGGGGTPDLRNRFVVGAGSSYAVNSKGGSATASLPSHSHIASSNSTGAHTHITSLGANESSRVQWGSVGNYKTLAGQAYTTSKGAYTNSSGAHSHTISVANSGTSATNKNLPPYYALAYIMKL